jgi:hypothetical protein
MLSTVLGIIQDRTAFCSEIKMARDSTKISYLHFSESVILLSGTGLRIVNNRIAINLTQVTININHEKVNSTQQLR